MNEHEVTLKNSKEHCLPLETVATFMNTSSNKKADIRHIFKRNYSRQKTSRFPTEAKACGDPGCFTGPPHTWLGWVLPQVISTWGSKSSPHRDTQISAKNRIRMKPFSPKYIFVTTTTTGILFTHKSIIFKNAVIDFKWVLTTWNNHRG